MLRVGNLVVCRIDKILPHSAFVTILDTHEKGFIHISQVSNKWISRIDDFLRVGDEKVCKVINTRDKLELSLKAVNEKDTAKKLTELRNNKKASLVIDATAKKIKKTQEEADGLKQNIIKTYHSLNIFMELVRVEGEKALKECNVPEEWRPDLLKSFEKEKKKIKIKKTLIAYSLQDDGVERLKKTLKAEGKIIIRYISAPEYEIVLTQQGGNYATAEKELGNKIQELTEDGKKQGVIITVKEQTK